MKIPFHSWQCAFEQCSHCRCFNKKNYEDGTCFAQNDNRVSWKHGDEFRELSGMRKNTWLYHKAVVIQPRVPHERRKDDASIKNITYHDHDVYDAAFYRC